MRRLISILSRPAFWFVGYFCWFALLFFLSEQHGFGVKMETFPHSDKVLHAVYFAAGATVLGLGILLKKPAISRAILLGILLTAGLAVGVFDEWHQTYTPGREGNSLGDIIADVVGAGIGFFVACSLFRFAQRKALLQGSAP